MGVKFSGKLLGKTLAELKHEPSGTVLKTVAPVDNGGDGSTFSPTDLFASSLGGCVAITIGLYVQKHNIPLDGVEFTLEKKMTTSSPRRISKIEVNFFIKTNCNDEDFKRIIQVAKACPVRYSLHQDIEVIENFSRV